MIVGSDYPATHHHRWGGRGYGVVCRRLASAVGDGGARHPAQDVEGLLDRLTAEVELKFKSDYFPLERFAKTGVIAQIQQNTANPQANAAAPQNAGSAAGR